LPLAFPALAGASARAVWKREGFKKAGFIVITGLSRLMRQVIDYIA
jgi:hypothetical protein